MREKDFTPTGLKLEGNYENDRNQDYKDLCKAIIREVYNVEDVIIGHHLLYVVEEDRIDETTGLSFKYQIVEEIPAIDTMIFDHEVAQKLWGSQWKEKLRVLACEPPDSRCELLSKLYYGRAITPETHPAKFKAATN